MTFEHSDQWTAADVELTTFLASRRKRDRHGLFITVAHQRAEAYQHRTELLAAAVRERQPELIAGLLEEDRISRMADAHI